MRHIKVKLILLAAFAAMAYEGDRKLGNYEQGFADGLAQSDIEAFDAYTHFAKKMHAETHRAAAAATNHPKAKADDLFTQAGL